MRIGIDIGASKIEAAALSAGGAVATRHRLPTPPAYRDMLDAIAALVERIEADAGTAASVGIGFPGRIDKATGRLRSSTALDGQRFQNDIEAVLGRPVRIANDGACFTLSEATDGAAAGRRTVFGVILGTGCGGAVAVDGRLLDGPNGVAGEWGHSPFPFVSGSDFPPPRCWCGRAGCIEAVLAGPALARDADGPLARDASGLPDRAAAGDEAARAALDRHAERLARALGWVVNLIDPDAIVLGGGLSNMGHLYARLPALLAEHVFGGSSATPILKPMHGDSSGVRGAAWLWP
ncbi:MAG: ROK family protein [Alphaproteobacteria bacterium]|nr:ROK family protein [Alphaproteobacteria bacterium]